MFKNVHHITAGAGAGKTTELVRIITRLVNDEGADPSRMILTTYTVAAATEFRERSKAALPVDKAIAMNAAQMGTLHSLAEKYINRYWYLLGISPSVKPISENVSDILMDRSLEGLVNGDQLNLFKKYIEAFRLKSGEDGYDYDFWKKTLKKLFNMMRRYTFGKDKVEGFRNMTSALLRETFTQDGNKALLDAARPVMEAYLGYEDIVSGHATDTGKKTYLNNCEQVKRIRDLDPLSVSVKDLEEIKEMKWGADIAFDTKFADKEYYKDEIKARKEDVIAAQAAICGALVPKEHELIFKVTDLIFDLLPAWMDAYTDIKRESGVIDFTDMEGLFLKLLGRDEVLEDIRKSVDYLFVDEFQDSNPVQARIYEIISNQIVQSWFVGDRKQAIYGFAGSDSGLISELTRSFPEMKEDVSTRSGYATDAAGNSSQILGLSHRSTKKLVDAANVVFEKAFEDTAGGKSSDAIVREHVHLGWGGNTPDTAWDPLYHVVLEGDNNSARADALATYICDMVQQDGFRKAGYTVSDIAILTRSGTQAINIGNALTRKDIPTAFVDPKGFRDTPEVSLLLAILKLSDGIDLAKSRAEIRKLVRDEDLWELVEKVKGENNTLDDLPGLEAFAKSIRHHAVPDRINEIIVRTDLYGLCGRWGNPDSRRGHINLVRSAAAEYADKAGMLCIEADLRGFLSFLDGYKVEAKFDNTAKGVKVLTYHKSKGLEWKIVILCGLDDYKEDASIAGVTILGPSAAPDGILAVPRLPETPWALACVGGAKRASEILAQIRATKLGEEKRLLYVGFTRAREVVVTAAKSTSPEVITKLCPTAHERVDTLPSGDVVDIWGIPGVKSRLAAVAADPESGYAGREQAFMYKDAGLFLSGDKIAAEGLVKYNSPSKWRDASVQNAVKVVTVKDFGVRTDIPHPRLDDNVFGDCIHHIFAVCRPGCHEANLVAAIRTLVAFGITDPNAPEKILSCIEMFFGWLESSYGPSAEMETEFPFRYTDEQGRVFSGSMDLVWVTGKGCVLVDYKTFSGKRSDLFCKDGKHWAGNYASQLHVYGRALGCTELDAPMDKLLFYPVEGLVLRVG